MESKEKYENLGKTVTQNVYDEVDITKSHTIDKLKQKQIKSKKRNRKRSSISSESSSSSEDSSDISSDSSRSSSESSERSRSRKHKKKSKKHKKHKSIRPKENRSNKNKKGKSSPEPKKSKWTTVIHKSESPIQSRSNVVKEENRDINVSAINNIYEEEEEKNKEIEKEKPNFKPSGILAKETNTVNGVVVKFTEPLDAAVPSEFWRLYPFKDNECQDPLHIHKQSNYLVGKDKRISHILVNHPSCSRQHAVIQYREYKSIDEGGKINIEIKPYLMDLESTNGTFLNKTKIESARYYELKNYDIINFGFSTRDYIITKVSMN